MLKPVINSRNAPKFVIRLPDGMRDQIGDVARNNKRSMNSEIISRLERSLAADNLDTVLPDALVIYLPNPLLAEIDSQARVNERSTNAEVTYRLKRSVTMEQLCDEQARMIGILQRRLEELERQLQTKEAA